MIGVSSVSVVIPVFNRRSFILEAVRSACEQDPRPLEVIAVDDGSTDGSAEAAGAVSPLVKIIEQQHTGRSAARNAGIRAAEGEFIAFLDSDDTWMPGNLARQLAILAQFPEAGMVAGHVWAVDENDAPLPDSTTACRRILQSLVREGCSLEALVRHSGIFTSTLIVRRGTLNEVGLFDERLEGNEDWDLELRLVRRYALAVTPWPPVASYRVHGGGTSALDMARGTTQLVRNHLAMSPPPPRRIRALLRVRCARSYRTLGEQRDARDALMHAVFEAPIAAVRAGALRVAAGSLLPRSLAKAVRRLRSGENL
jgi:glycosyltransferase involved in cell wall biosynthesis